MPSQGCLPTNQSINHHLFRHKIKEYILENYTRTHIYNKCFWREDYPIAELIDRKPPTESYAIRFS